jgi:hypothetical protein
MTRQGWRWQYRFRGWTRNPQFLSSGSDSEVVRLDNFSVVVRRTLDSVREQLLDFAVERGVEVQRDVPINEAWPQPFDNSQRMWSYDRMVTIGKPLVTAPWRSLGFYALTGKSTIPEEPKDSMSMRPPVTSHHCVGVGVVV